MMKKGVIYILTNSSFPDYVKIGYTHDLKMRLISLNRSSAIPREFRAYAIYEVDSEMTDKRLHKLIDSLNPSLRSEAEYSGKKHPKEFFKMSAAEAYSLLECIATISGTQDRLKHVDPEGDDVLDNQTAEEVNAIKLFIKTAETDVSGLFTSEGLIVCRGSKIRATQVPSCPEWVKKMRNTYKNCIGTNFILLEDILFSSPSAAAAFCVFGAANGTILWKDESGQTLKARVSKES